MYRCLCECFWRVYRGSVRIIFMLFLCSYLGFCCLVKIGLCVWVVLLTRCVS